MYPQRTDTTQTLEQFPACKLSPHECEDYKSAIAEAARNSGSRFLFELPGAMFGFENSIASTVTLDGDNQFERLAFIIFDQDTGMFNIISEDEAPESAMRFVQSYVNLLDQLHLNNITAH